MDLASHQLAQSLVDQLVTRDGPQPGELGRDHPRGEMGVVVGFDAHRGAGQPGADQLGDALGGHGACSWREFSGARGIIPA